MNDQDRIAPLTSYQKKPLLCSYIGAPCERMGTPACGETATITCRNIRQRNERKEEACLKS